MGTVIINLSKTFDTIKHDLVIAKLEAYEFARNALSYIHSYLKKCFQSVNVNNIFSAWEETIAGVPQQSVLGPLLFNVFLNDIFLCESKYFLGNYADDNVLSTFNSKLEEVKYNLRLDLSIISKWFYESFMVLNPDKCHNTCLGKDTLIDALEFCDAKAKASKLETIQEVE